MAGFCGLARHETRSIPLGSVRSSAPRLTVSLSFVSSREVPHLRTLDPTSRQLMNKRSCGAFEAMLTELRASAGSCPSRLKFCRAVRRAAL